MDELAARTAWTAPVAQTAAAPVDARELERMRLVALARAGQRIVAVGEYGHVIYSDDRGAHWFYGANAADRMLTAVDFVGTDLGFATGHDASLIGSQNHARTWLTLYGEAQPQGPLLSLRMRDAQHGIAVGAYGLIVRMGATGWEALARTDDDRHLYGVAWVDDRRAVIVGERGYIALSDDDGVHWRNVASPYAGSLFGVVHVGARTLIAYGMRGKLLRSADGGEHWTEIASPTASFLIGADVASDGRILIAGLAGTLIESRDAGQHFTAVPTQRKDGFAGVLAIDADTVLLVGDHGPVLLPRTEH